MNDQTEVTLAATGKVATYLGGAGTVVSALTLQELGIVFGIALGLLGYVTQLYFSRRRDRRETDEYETRMRGYQERGSASRPVIGGLVLASAGLLAFLGLWEGDNQYRVYADKLAQGLPTVCKGLTRHITATPIVVGEVWTPDKCEREERAAVEKVQLQLLKCFVMTPSQSVFDAATSHAWNVGAGSTCKSSAMSAWNRGEWALGCKRLYQSDAGKPVWSYVKTGRMVGGKPEYKLVRGLANRREAEYRYCMGAAA